MPLLAPENWLSLPPIWPGLPDGLEQLDQLACVQLDSGVHLQAARGIHVRLQLGV